MDPAFSVFSAFSAEMNFVPHKTTTAHSIIALQQLPDLLIPTVFFIPYLSLFEKMTWIILILTMKKVLFILAQFELSTLKSQII